MGHDFPRPSLWVRVFGSIDSDKADKATRLENSFIVFRDRASELLKRISVALPDLTVHDITHIDALWETSDLIVGPNYPLNPLEIFVLGGAMLLHDAALCFEAYDKGLEGVRTTIQWKDAFAAENERNSERDRKSSASEVEFSADFSALRLLHANQASLLVDCCWNNPSTGQPYFLIDDSELRNRFGRVIGLIAASHGWSIEDVSSKLPSQLGAPGDWPVEWRIDAVKIACILRCADAAHIDNRRAPDFLHALAKREGVSLQHWKAQNWLNRADLDQSDPSRATLLYTSNHEFRPEDAEAWWIAYDAILLVQKEIRQSNSLLKSRPQNITSPEFPVRQVAGTSSPEMMSNFLQTIGWRPCHAEIHVGNIERLVRNLGGQNLYGSTDEEEQFAIVLRELLQNARDAILARREMDSNFEGLISVDLYDDGTSPPRLEVTDNGIGMSERVLTGPLLDFGSSFWRSDLLSEEFPGLRSSRFRSIGKYGIGFYSVFMAASSVRVASRRWDRGLDTVASIVFPKGLTLRPIFSVGEDEAIRSSASTKVTCVLKENPKFRPSTKTFRNGPNQELKVPFVDFLGRILVALDVDVDVSVNGNTPTRVHRAIESIMKDDVAKFHWLNRTNLSDYIDISNEVFADTAKRLRPLLMDGQLVGLAALRIDQQNNGRQFTGGGIATIGGFLTGGYGNIHGNGSYFGYMEQYSQSAKRDPGKEIATQEVVDEWISGQLILLSNRVLTVPEQLSLTHHLCDFKNDPSPYALALFYKRLDPSLLSIDQVFNLMKSEPIAFFKMNIMDHVDLYVQQLSYDNFLTFKPTGNSSFLSLELEGCIPKNPNSFIGCLHRRAARDSLSLNYEVRSKVVNSLAGPSDIVIVSLRTA